MYSLIAVFLLGLSAVLVYKKRFTSDISIGGLYFIQLYYLLVGPIMFALMLSLGFEILNRPPTPHIPVASGLIFQAYVFFLMIAAVGNGIHSTSTSVYQSFVKNKETPSPTFDVNEKFHGGLSHNLLFISVIFGSLSLALLEINHPALLPQIPSWMIIAFGVAIGLIQAIGIIRSTHISFSLVSTLIASAILFYFANPLVGEIYQYPIVVVTSYSFVTLFGSLSLMLLIFMASENWSKKVVKRVFPKGHRFHEEGVSLKLIRMKIERDWFE